MAVRLAIVVSHPVQHFVHLYRGLDDREDIDLRVFFGASSIGESYFDPGFGRDISWADDLLAGYSYEIASTGRPGERIASGRIFRALTDFDPDAVQVYGYAHGLSRAAMAWARRNRRVLLYVSDSDLLSRKGALLDMRRRVVVPWLLRGVDLALAVGDSNDEFYRRYAPRVRIERCPFTFDSAALDDAVSERPHHRAALRAQLGVPTDTCVLLYVGKLVEGKRPRDAIEAVARAVHVSEKRIYLVLAGDGPQRADLESLCSITQAPARLLGFVNTDCLPLLYAAADALVHPSAEDRHPLAVSEAVYSGLPVLVSDRVGCVGEMDDLCLGENALQHPVGDVAVLARNIADLCNRPGQLDKLAAGSRARARGRDVGSVVNLYVEALLDVMH